MNRAQFEHAIRAAVVGEALLPRGWEQRLVRFVTPATAGVVAWCLSPEDLWVSKALAGRPKDLELCRALLHAGVVQRDTMSALIDETEAHTAQKRAARQLLAE